MKKKICRVCITYHSHSSNGLGKKGTREAYTEMMKEAASEEEASRRDQAIRFQGKVGFLNLNSP